MSCYLRKHLDTNKLIKNILHPRLSLEDQPVRLWMQASLCAAPWCSRLRTSQTPRCCRCGIHRSQAPWREALGRPRRSQCHCRSGTDSLYGRAIRLPPCQFASPRAVSTNRDAASSLPVPCCRTRELSMGQNGGSGLVRNRWKLRGMVFTWDGAKQENLCTKIEGRRHTSGQPWQSACQRIPAAWPCAWRLGVWCTHPIKHRPTKQWLSLTHTVTAWMLPKVVHLYCK